MKSDNRYGARYLKRYEWEADKVQSLKDKHSDCE